MTNERNRENIRAGRHEPPDQRNGSGGVFGIFHPRPAKLAIQGRWAGFCEGVAAVGALSPQRPDRLGGSQHSFQHIGILMRPPLHPPVQPVTQPYGFVANLRVQRAAGFDADLQNMTFRVFALIVTYADKNGECYPSIAKMAKKLGVSRQAIQNQIRKLVDKGYLKSCPQTSRTNIYKILQPAAGCPAPQPHAVDTAATPFGCPKIPLKKTDKDHRLHSRVETKWGGQRAYYQEKRREHETGISKTDEVELQMLREQAHHGLNVGQRIEMDMDLQASATRLHPNHKQRHEYLKSRYAALRDATAREAVIQAE